LQKNLHQGFRFLETPETLKFPSPAKVSTCGRSIPLSLPRRWIGDLLHFGNKVPTVAAERTLRLAPLAQARRAMQHPPNWCALLIKAFSIVARDLPELRRSYLPFPWPRLYESPHSVATVVLDRVWQGEHVTLFAPIIRPEELSIREIQSKLDRLKNDEVESSGAFRRLIRGARFPRPIRRALWKYGLEFSGSMRTRYFGTFAVNSVAAFRGRMLQFVSPLTSVIYYDHVTSRGEMNIQCAIDHRVFDGYAFAKASSEIESVLNREIVAELKQEEQVLRAAA
jgi:hypothetical protein